jgi:GDP-L-fucose synthase
MLDLATKKIVIAGGGGFLGSHLVEALAKRGVPKENIFIPRSKDFDLRVNQNCKKIVAGQEILFDLSVIAGDLEIRKKIPGTIFYDNILMGIQLLEAARIEGLEKIITIGSAVEYPEDASTPLKESDLWNGKMAEVNLPYAIAKKAILVQGQLYRKQYGLNTIHLMPTNIYGPRERVASGYLMPSMINKILEAKKTNQQFIDAWGTGEPIRDFIYIDDVVEGILQAAEKYNEAEPVNLGTGKGVSIKELFELIASIAGFSGDVRWDSSKPNGQMKRLMDTSLAKEKFGFIAKTKLVDGLKKTIRWHEENE